MKRGARSSCSEPRRLIANRPGPRRSRSRRRPCRSRRRSAGARARARRGKRRSRPSGLPSTSTLRIDTPCGQSRISARITAPVVTAANATDRRAAWDPVEGGDKADREFEANVSMLKGLTMTKRTMMRSIAVFCALGIAAPAGQRSARKVNANGQIQMKNPHQTIHFNIHKRTVQYWTTSTIRAFLNYSSTISGSWIYGRRNRPGSCSRSRPGYPGLSGLNIVAYIKINDVPTKQYLYGHAATADLTYRHPVVPDLEPASRPGCTR